METPPIIPTEKDLAEGYSELLPYILPSPYQDEAGSCLYMAVTGIAEWHLARLYPSLSRRMNGPLDLSERFLMNLAGLKEEDNGVSNWKTDSIYLFNDLGFGLLNQVFPFTKGFYRQGKNEPLRLSSQNESQRQYGTYYNWISQINQFSPLDQAPGRVGLPLFTREILYADPQGDQWNTGVAPQTIVETIKTALRTRKAPVLVIYNHHGYWHANVIVGYNDEIPHDCPFVEGFLSYMKKQAERYQRLAENSPAREGVVVGQHPDYLRMARKFHQQWEKTHDSYLRGGGCRSKGAFFVRDSLYPDQEGPLYDYDSGRTGEEAPLSKKVILREYDWVLHLANHVVQIRAGEL